MKLGASIQVKSSFECGSNYLEFTKEKTILMIKESPM